MPGSSITITGKQLISLLQKDGWIIRRRARHGLSLSKCVDGTNIVTIVPYSRAVLPAGTLSAILGDKQTGIGRNGLLDLINKYK